MPRSSSKRRPVRRARTPSRKRSPQKRTRSSPKRKYHGVWRDTFNEVLKWTIRGGF